MTIDTGCSEGVHRVPGIDKGRGHVVHALDHLVGDAQALQQLRQHRAGVHGVCLPEAAVRDWETSVGLRISNLRKARFAYPADYPNADAPAVACI